jgi:hypothetical protein
LKTALIPSVSEALHLKCQLRREVDHPRTAGARYQTEAGTAQRQIWI